MFNKNKALEENNKCIEIALRKEGRILNPDEIVLLNNYSGFGAIKEILLPIEDKTYWTNTDLKYYDKIVSIHNTIKRNTSSEEDYKNILQELKNNTFSAFYTPTNVCEAIVESIKGKIEVKSILEPSSGNGKFIDAIQHSYPKASINAIEKDSLTASILGARKSDSNNVTVSNCGFEDVEKSNKYELVISNIPFGQIQVFDKDYAKEKSVKNDSCDRIHNYFFVKGLEHLEDKGILAYITTSAFSDSPSNEPFRKHLVENSNLIGMIRFPNDLFNESGTEVGTDLIILQKDSNKKELSNQEKAFIETIKHEDINLNRLIAEDNSRIIAKKTVIDTNQYGQKAFIHTHGDINGIHMEIKNALKDIQLQKKEEKMVQNSHGKQLSFFDFNEFIDERINIPTGRYYENGFLYLHKNKIVELKDVEIDKSKAHHIERNFNTQDTKILKEYIQLRDAFYTLKFTKEEENKERLRNELNSKYEEFSKNNLSLNFSKVKAALKNCSSSKEVTSSLERRIVNNNIISYQKGDILLPREKADKKFYTINEALSICLNQKGKVDIDMIISLTNKKREDLYSESKEIIFYNPQKSEFETRDEFLSGNVVEKKLFFERKYSEKDLKEGNPYLVHTYNALCSVQPQKIPFELIDINMGERWIDKSAYQDFARKLFKDEKINLTYSETLDKYELDYNKNANNQIIQEEFAVQTQSRKIRGNDLFEHAIHNTAPTITMNIGTGKDKKTIIDSKATQEASTKIETIRSKFKKYLNELSKENKDLLTENYNYLYNSSVKRQFNASHLTFSDLQGKIPREHQKNAVWMIIQNNGGIIDHPVGAGKTLTMCMAAHEMKRLGFARKPAIIGLKPNITQIADEYKNSYPNDKVLFPSKDDLEKDNRIEFFHQMKNQDWDCIIMTHEQFASIPQNRNVQVQLIKEELENINEDLKEIKRQGGKVSRDMLQGLEQRKISKEKKLETLYATQKKDDVVDFSETGIDHIFVDESQKFKNLEYSTRHDRVAGLGNQNGSGRSFNMLTAIRTLQMKNNKDLGVTFLSGTTISNSLTEMYSLFKYLRPKELKRQCISNFDSWIAVFAQKSTEYEFNITNELVMKERFRTFVKVPELATFYNQITDYKTFEDLKLDKPDLDIELVVCKQSPEQKEFSKNLIEFAKTGNTSLIDRKPLEEHQKNSKMLIATDYAKRMAVDMRLVNPTKYEDNNDNKISQMCKNIADYYQKSEYHKGTQAIFCDMGTPGTLGFNIYNAIKEKLITEYGINEKEIAFVHSATTDKKKEKLFENVNNGSVRIIIGSTQKMGTGVNMQQRMVAMHDLNIPWTPADLEQRHGRGARQGNLVAKEHFGNKVKTFVYATENTLDVYIFNLLKNKQLFIDQIKKNSMNSRSIDEGSVEENSMSFAEYVAILSGNTDLLDKAKIDNKITVIESEKSIFYKEFNNNERNLSNALSDIERNSFLLDTLVKDKTHLDSVVQLDKHGTKINAVILEGVNYTGKEPETIGKKIIEIFNQKQANSDYNQIGELYGFKLAVRTENTGINKLFVLSQDDKIKYTFNNGIPNLENPSYASRYFMSALNKMDSMITDCEITIKNNQQKVPFYKEMLTKKWPEEKEIKLQELKEESMNIDRKIKGDLNSDNNTVNEPNENYKKRNDKGLSI